MLGQREILGVCLAFIVFTLDDWTSGIQQFMLCMTIVNVVNLIEILYSTGVIMYRIYGHICRLALKEHTFQLCVKDVNLIDILPPIEITISDTTRQFMHNFVCNGVGILDLRWPFDMVFIIKTHMEGYEIVTIRLNLLGRFVLIPRTS